MQIKLWTTYSSYWKWSQSLGKIATILQVTTMLATYKHVLFPGYNNHLLTIGTDGPSL